LRRQLNRHPGTAATVAAELDRTAVRRDEHRCYRKAEADLAVRTGRERCTDPPDGPLVKALAVIGDDDRRTASRAADGYVDDASRFRVPDRIVDEVDEHLQ